MKTDGVDGDESCMENSRHNRVKNMGDEHDAFDQEEKDGEHGDDDIVVCDTVQPSFNQSYPERQAEENVQLAPWQRIVYRPVVGICVEDLIRIAVPSMIGSFLPEFGAI